MTGIAIVRSPHQMNLINDSKENGFEVKSFYHKFLNIYMKKNRDYDYSNYIKCILKMNLMAGGCF